MKHRNIWDLSKTFIIFYVDDEFKKITIKYV